MKRLICLLFPLLLAAGLLFGCAEKEVLYSFTDGERVISVLGGSGRANYLSVTENGKDIWQTRIRADRTVGSRGGTYGLRVEDVNFDGRNDLIIALTVTDDITTEQVYLQQSDGSYRLNTELDGKCNLSVDARQELILAFERTDITERDAGTDRTYHVKTDTATAYSWQGAALIPRRRVSLTYYGGSGLYCYSVADYDASLGAWKTPDDRWFSPDEVEQQSFEGLYYFR